MSVSDHRPSWRRNFLPTYTRFASPLHVAFPFPPQPGKRVIIGPDPIPDADDASREATFLNVQAIQRLDTVNCLWDACTVLCGYMIAHANQIFDRCSLGSRNRFTVVEIGSGCGVLGMVAEECLQSHARTRSGTPEVVVVMTEIESEIDVLKQTVSLNKEGSVFICSAPWNLHVHLFRSNAPFG
ncbi:hypothetical protein DFJ73DRAFT_384169 [Zopfochytrium polystomum]|nr:hypothetical protein DFJ73DRAFT_384169 [Zopfochytrium polystomum]